MAFRFPLDKLMQDSYNVATWHLLLLLPQWCFVLPLCGAATRHREIWIQLKHFIVRDWENLQEEFFLHAQVLAASLNSIFFSQHDLPTHKCLLRSLALGYVWEYFRTTCTLALFSLASTFFDTTSTLITLHPETNGYFSFFLEDYEPN
jgi:hypothetical protein